jgi:ribose/xylose/arabinose/galactoside ABC-type transport system permease subunit
MADIGKFLIGLGVVLIVIGGLLVLSSSLGLRVPFGRLPGDVHVQRGNWSFYFPITTSIVLSLVLTLIFWVLSRR